MKKIFMRAGMTPTEAFTPYQMLTQNILASNVGNLLYQYGVCRTLYTENTDFLPNRYAYANLKEEDIKQINEECSYFIIPLADAFRDTFVGELRKLTNLVKKLTIPCVVTGVGLRAPFEPNLKDGFSFDNDVKDFVSAVLEKSSMLGLRGEITSQYLSNLGFKEGRDHTVIGCPSMYSAGRKLYIRDTKINQFSSVSINSSNETPVEIQQFIMNNAKKFKKSTFVPQLINELKVLYGGDNFLGTTDISYPKSLTDDYYTNNNVKFFLNAFSWFDFLSTVDLSFGSRLHGTIAGYLAGTPSIVIPKDARVRELSSYHNMTILEESSLSSNTNILNLVENLDFKSPCKVQKRNFDHFIDFLNINKLEHAFMKNRNLENVPYDSITKNCDHKAEAKSLILCNSSEVATRVSKYNQIQSKNISKLRKQIKDKDKEILNLNKKNSL